MPDFETVPVGTTVDLERVKEERDELAALFVKMQDAAISLIHASSEEEAGDAMELISECSEKEARATLARRDLLKQAEGLEAEAEGWPADKYTECSHVREGILESAANLRQQANQLETNQ